MVAWRTTVVLPLIAPAPGRAALLLVVALNGSPSLGKALRRPQMAANCRVPTGPARGFFPIASGSTRIAGSTALHTFLVETFGVETSLPLPARAALMGRQIPHIRRGKDHDPTIRSADRPPRRLACADRRGRCRGRGHGAAAARRCGHGER